MDLRHIRAAARDSLRRANKSPYLLTFLFIASIQVLLVIFNLVDYRLGQTVSGGLSGLSARNMLATAFSGLSLVLTYLSAIWSCNYQNYALNLSRGKETSFRDFTVPFSIIGSVFFLLVMSNFFIVLWGMLFLIPGIIAAYRYRFAFLILFDQECGAREALNESKRLTYGYKMDLFRLDLSFFWFYLLSFLPEIINLLQLYGFVVIPDRLAIPVYLGSALYSILVFTLFYPYVAASTAHLYNQVLTERSQNSFDTGGTQFPPQPFV